MKSKYSLLVKEEIDKLLEIGIIYPFPNIDWVLPIVVMPKKKVNSEYVWITRS